MSTQTAHATYRVSALAKGLAVMWRGSRIAVPFMLLNTVVQAVLVWLDTQSGFTLAFLLAFLVSGVSALALYAALTRAALRAVDGQAVAGHTGLFVGWAIVQWVLILLASLVTPVLVLAVAALTPFLPLAAMEGRGNALGANFSALGRRFGRWLVTTLILAVGGLVLFLLSAVNTFFIKGTPAAVFFWLAAGVVAWWVLTAWALVYRAARRPE